MDVYNINFDFILELVAQADHYLMLDWKQSSILFCIFVMLLSILSLTRKLRKMERLQSHDIDDVTSFNRLIDDEIGILKGKINKIDNEKNKSKEVSDKLFNNAPYSQAVQLARRGYTRDDIISLCSLTESEAELIFALHTSSEAA